MNTLAPSADVLFVFAGLITLGYVVVCAFWPYKACRSCGGYGRISGPFGGIRLCRGCDATGVRLRLGRRVWNAVRRLCRDINNRRHG